MFVDGLPAEWNEAQGESFFAKFGDVESVVLARSIPSAKRGDYGFITFTTRAAALAAIEALHEKEVADGDSAVRATSQLTVTERFCVSVNQAHFNFSSIG